MCISIRSALSFYSPLSKKFMKIGNMKSVIPFIIHNSGLLYVNFPQSIIDFQKQGFGYFVLNCVPLCF